MMTLSTDDLIAALRLRYDYYSARSMFELACERAELAEKPAYDVAEVRAWRTALVAVGDRLDHVLARIDLMLGDESASPARAETATATNTASFEAVPAAQTASTREETATAPSRTVAAAETTATREKTAASAPTAPSQAASPNETAAAKPSVHATTGEETAVVTPKASAPTAPSQAASPKETAAAKPSVHATTGEETAVVTPKASAQAASSQATTREDTATATSKAAAATEEAVETTIVLTGVDVAEGEQILVCGAFPELGDWDPERARLMSRTGDEWLATIKVAPDTKVPFKFLRRTADGDVIWESGADRSLVAKPRLDATWR
jgi:hypothetical protein